MIGLKSSQIRFVTMPVEFPPDHNQRQWSSAADFLWTSIRDDVPLPGSKATPHAKVTAGPTPTPAKLSALAVSPDKITVQISNASGVNGRARQAADDLSVQGFHILGTATGADLTTGVTIGYASPYLQAARTVTAAFPGATLVKDESAGPMIQVILGTGSPYVAQVPNRVGSTPLPARTTLGATPTWTVTINACTADTSICAS